VRRAVRSKGPGDITLPVAVLIDKTTAASELLATALKTGRRATVIGHRSSGGSRMRSLDKKPDGTSEFHDLGQYLTASSGQITDAGVEPDTLLAPTATAQEFVQAAVKALSKADRIIGGKPAGP
jgi:C-terminal processing protease CtpA/Prc